jgi:hypothetical protein
MQRHGNDRVRAAQDFLAGRGHQARERDGQCAAAVVLVGVDDSPKGAFVLPRAPCDVQEWRLAAASGAQQLRHAPRGKRIAASAAVRRRETFHRRPARRADGTSKRAGEGLMTRNAHRFEQRPDDEIDHRWPIWQGTRQHGSPVIPAIARGALQFLHFDNIRNR